MGLILLVGLVVKNGIVLMDFAARRHAAGTSWRESLVAAGARRFRPIMMTTLCTLGGLLPLAFGLGAGAELQRPLALAVIGGLSLSTLLVLYVLPALFLLTRVARTDKVRDCPQSASVLGDCPPAAERCALGTVPNWLRSWGQSPLDRNPDWAAHARAAEPAVAVRVLREVLLVVVLGVVELGRRQDLRRDRAVARRRQAPPGTRRATRSAASRCASVDV